ncbi:hypothetical protein FJZ40_02990 [Candidatus Shapirobacteria bacterium]|nr:hypothetical protein [Candidatus Shapirobacteria bacterium]
MSISLAQKAVLKREAAQSLKRNIFREGKLDRDYTSAAGKTLPFNRFLYPFQWLWDTFFVSAWTPDIRQGIKDVRKFLAGQKSNGELGHIRYNREVLGKAYYFPPPNIYFRNGILPEKGEVTSRITQPPNVAYGIWELAKKREKRTYLSPIAIGEARFGLSSMRCSLTVQIIMAMGSWRKELETTAWFWWPVL